MRSLLANAITFRNEDLSFPCDKNNNNDKIINMETVDVTAYCTCSRETCEGTCCVLH